MWKFKKEVFDVKRITRQFRNALDVAWKDDKFRKLYPYNNLSNDFRGHTCDLLSQYLMDYGNMIVIQDHSAGYEKGNQRSHFNVQPGGRTRKGKVPRTQGYYPFEI